MGNFYHLVVDDSASKRWQIVIIIVQCILSIGTYFLTIYVENTHQLFIITLGIEPETGKETLFYTTIFISIPIIMLMLLFFMSFHKSILTKDHRLERKELENQ
jgi:hypothetical protein